MAELSESRIPARDAVVRPLSRAAQRPCSRPGCPSPSRATLDFSYETRAVRLIALTDEASPQSYDLCAGHADRTSAPYGWELVDERPDDADGPAVGPGELDSPRTVAVLAAALRGRTDDEDASPALDVDDPLREALEELQAVSAGDDAAPSGEMRSFPSRAPSRDEAEAELDLEALSRILAPEPDTDDDGEAEVLARAVEEVGAAMSQPPMWEPTDEPATSDTPRGRTPGRPVLARREHPTDDDGRATLW